MNSNKSNGIQMGVCYYPEHWPESMWEDDFGRMKEMGLSTVRMAEFAWSIFEPEEGVFQFDLFDRVLQIAHRHGLQVVLGTPTAAPPAWLTQKYPEVLNVSKEGVVYRHGERRHTNYNSPKYRELSARIVSEMANHYKEHPAVIGWQIDNEFNCHIAEFYSPSDHDAFRHWLQEKYRSLEQLNHTWGTVFWSQTYSDWSQVHLTLPGTCNSPNPHQALDEKRFISASTIAYARIQSDILRSICPHHWITTNGMFNHVDSHQLTEECLDFYSYDSYPGFGYIFPDPGEDPLLDRKWSWNLTKTRSVCANYCVAEQQSGPGGWTNNYAQPTPEPGQIRLWTYQSVAHGADKIWYFRWRTATFGTEIYWHGIHNYDNRPNRRSEEVKQVISELKQLGEQFLNTQYVADVAIVSDYDNEWDGELDEWHGPMERNSAMSWFKVLQKSHIPVDMLNVNAKTNLNELKAYKYLIYPHPTIMSEATAKLLKSHVQLGGIIIFGCRSGYKNEAGHCLMTPLPGVLADLCGIEIHDFTMIVPTKSTPHISFKEEWGADRVLAAAFNDILSITSDSAEALAVYDGAFYSGMPASTMNRYGQGLAYYYGAEFTEPAVEALLRIMGLSSPVNGEIDLPSGVELAIRENRGTGEQFIFLLNYKENTQIIKFHIPMKDLLTSSTLEGLVEMKPYEVRVLKK